MLSLDLVVPDIRHARRVRTLLPSVLLRLRPIFLYRSQQNTIAKYGPSSKHGFFKLTVVHYYPVPQNLHTLFFRFRPQFVQGKRKPLEIKPNHIRFCWTKKSALALLYPERSDVFPYEVRSFQQATLKSLLDCNISAGGYQPWLTYTTS
jgi:hypothetical protein